MDTQKKARLIKKHPCFSSLPDVEINKLAQLFTEKNIPIKTKIVKQDDVVDSIYFIVNGTAEVRRKNPGDKKSRVVATLHEGEAIGLSEIGFYSTSGLRAATVTAVTKMTVIKVDLDILHAFLKSHPQINTGMQANAEIMLRMLLIKQAAPFAKISPENTRWLAEQVTEIDLPKNTIVFNKGDSGDFCYLIKSGEVEIFIPNPDNTETSVAKLKTPMVFGEAALLLNLPRTASARALKSTHLIALSREAMLHITKSEKRAGASLRDLVKLRSRPLKLPIVQTHMQKASDEEEMITLQNPQNNSYYRLQEEGYSIWKMMNGKNTLRDITVGFNKQYGIFDAAMITDFVMDLEEGGFIETLSGDDEENKKAQPRWLKVINRIQSIMEASVGFGEVDGWITKSYNKWVHYLFTKTVLYTGAVITVVGFILFLTHFNANITTFRASHNTGWIIIAAISGSMLTIFLHELAHAYTTKFFGRKVANFGIGWFWIGPVAFCDTTDMWLAPAKQRVWVDVAGMLVDSFIGGLACVLALFTSNVILVIFLWLFALYHYLAVFVNLTPIIELDGYYALMDATGKDNLRESAIVWLIRDFKKSWNKPAKLWAHKSDVAYWLACFAYLGFSVFVNYYVINTLLAGVSKSQHHYLGYALTLFALVISLLGVWGKIQKSIATPPS
ncbi:MAG: PqqD family peptide modification chaperone [Gammaproteobacteria bacterium]|nr:PqqD family peptide modification chaperone [Gammaproteobacteria bacterium]